MPFPLFAIVLPEKVLLEDEKSQMPKAKFVIIVFLIVTRLTPVKLKPAPRAPPALPLSAYPAPSIVTLLF